MAWRAGGPLWRVAVANRIITVGDPKRAQMLCGLLDPGFAVHTVASTRGFTVYSGTFNKVRVATAGPPSVFGVG